MANLREVAPRLYVGAQGAPRLADWDLVIDMCGGVDERPDYYHRAARVLSAPFEDGTPIPDGFLDRIVPEVGTALVQGEKVLVHCAAGLSRSASTVYAILREHFHLDHDEALRRVQTPGVWEYPHPVVLDSARAWVRGFH